MNKVQIILQSILFMTKVKFVINSCTLSARMLTSSESQWSAGQKGRLMSRAFTIFTKLVMTWVVDQTHITLTFLNSGCCFPTKLNASTFHSRGMQDFPMYRLFNSPNLLLGGKKQFENSAISAPFMESIKEKRPVPSLNVQSC